MLLEKGIKEIRRDGYAMCVLGNEKTGPPAGVSRQ
jgi:hypothetical protein